MIKLKILDRDTEGCIIHISELIFALKKHNPEAILGKWLISAGAYGYGETVCEIEDSLVDTEKLEIDSKRIFSILENRSECFYHIELFKIENTLSLGVFDSSYLYIKGEISLIQKINKEFKKTIIDYS